MAVRHARLAVRISEQNDQWLRDLAHAMRKSMSYLLDDLLERERVAANMQQVSGVTTDDR